MRDDGAKSTHDGNRGEHRQYKKKNVTAAGNLCPWNTNYRISDGTGKGTRTHTNETEMEKNKSTHDRNSALKSPGKYSPRRRLG